jgi:hypothetical protein
MIRARLDGLDMSKAWCEVSAEAECELVKVFGFRSLMAVLIYLCMCIVIMKRVSRLRETVLVYVFKCTAHLLR